jgi:hypothetical protein
MPAGSPRRMAGSPRKIKTNPPPVNARAHAKCNCGKCSRCVHNEDWRRWWYSQGRTKLHDPDYKPKAGSKRRLSEPSDAELDRRAVKWLEAIRG